MLPKTTLDQSRTETVPEKPVKELSKEEYKAYKGIHDEEAEMTRKG